MLLQISIFLLQALGFAIIFLIGWYFHVRTSQFYQMANRLPGPPVLPVLGNTLDLMGGPDIFIKMVHTKWAQKYGELFRMFAGKGCYVIISSPDLVESILKSQKYIEKGLSYDQLIPWLGRGLLTNYGESWKLRRRLMTPSFHFDILNSFIEIYNEQSKTFMKILKEHSEKSKGKPVEVNSLAARCTLDIICEAAMGTKINAQLCDTAYSQSVHRVGEIFTEQFQKPWLMNPWIFSMTSLGRDQRRVLKVLNGFSDQVINERRKCLQTKSDEKKDDEYEGKKKRLALLDLLLDVSEGDQPLSHEEIRNEINTFMFAGHDTTSALVSWFLYAMATHIDHQEKVREELFQVFGDSDRHCTQDDFPNMKHFECCIKETLRLYPSAPVFERAAIDDVQLGDYVIPAGCSMLISVYAMHRNSKLYDDPLAFKPERFYPDESDRRHSFAYIPFSAGPRNCIGQRFAMNEARVILSTLLRHLKFEVDDQCAPPQPAVLLTLKSLTGINLIVKPRF